MKTINVNAEPGKDGKEGEIKAKVISRRERGHMGLFYLKDKCNLPSHPKTNMNVSVSFLLCSLME